jgi:hypothetical protein
MKRTTIKGFKYWRLMDKPVYNFSGALNKGVGLLFGGLSQGGHLVCTTENKITVAYCNFLALT